jgi:tetratricopeptide (TPR) repeat protein
MEKRGIFSFRTETPRRTEGSDSAERLVIRRLPDCLRIRIVPLFCVTVVLCLGSCAAAAGEELQRYARAGDMYAQGRFSETVGLLEGMNKFPPALVLKAKAEYFSGELEKAENTCRQAIRRRHSSYEARLYLARILRDKGDLSEAEKTAEFLLADNPQDIRALRLASNLALERGKTGEAAALLDQAAELSAESALVLLDRARLHWTAGRGAEALEDLSRARAMLPWETPLARSVGYLETSIREALQ